MDETTQAPEVVPEPAPLSEWARIKLEDLTASSTPGENYYVQACALVSIAESLERVKYLVGCLEPLAQFVPMAVEAIRAEVDPKALTEELAAVMGRHFTEWDGFDLEERSAVVRDLFSVAGVQLPAEA